MSGSGKSGNWGPRVQATLAIARDKSENRKIGACATTYTAQQSCPSSCVFKDGGGCYAEEGWLGRVVTRPLNAFAGAASPERIALAEVAAIHGLPADKPLRLHTVGDCSTPLAARMVAAASKDYMARGGGPVWTYTHAWEDVARSDWGDVSVLASCETEEQIADAWARGYATAVVVPEFPTSRAFYMGKHKVVPCPAQTRDVACSDCRLCFKDSRLWEQETSIGFAVHGGPYATRHATMALNGDPLHRVTSRTWIEDYRRTHAGAWPRPRDVKAALGITDGSASQMLGKMKLSDEQSKLA